VVPRHRSSFKAEMQRTRGVSMLFAALLGGQLPGEQEEGGGLQAQR
jgi:hypothetical protein